MDTSLAARVPLRRAGEFPLSPAASGAARLGEMDVDAHRVGQQEVNEVDKTTQKDTSHGFARQR